MISEQRIAQVLWNEADVHVACKKLVDAANSAGGGDNVTVVVLQVGRWKCTRSRCHVKLPPRMTSQDALYDFITKRV